MVLSDLPKGTPGIVTAVNGDGPVTRRLLEMGIVPGISVEVVRAAPFGDPIQVKVMGYSLAMRKSEADAIQVGD